MHPLISRLRVHIGIISASLMMVITTAIGAEPIVFRHVNVIAMDGEAVLPNQVVVVENGSITRVAPEGTSSDLPSGITVNARGKYMLPGLAEMHAHIPPSDDDDNVRQVLALYLSQGITTIRGMLGEAGHLKLRQRQIEGTIAAPRILAGGPSLNGNSVSSPEDGARQVREQHAAGYDHLKLHPGLSLAQFDAIAKQAHALNMPFTGHVSQEVGAWHAIASGQTSIDHMDGFVQALVPKDSPGAAEAPGFFGLNLAPYADAGKVDELARRIAEADVWVVPTEALMARILNDQSTSELLAEPGMRYVTQATKDQWRQAREFRRAGGQFDRTTTSSFLNLRLRLIKALDQAGERILLGSDAPQIMNVPGFAIHHELALYVKAGLSPYQALRSGTVNVASYQGLERQRGQIKVGYDADLVLLQRNPLEDVGNARHIAGVMVAGRWYSGQWIAEQLAAIEKSVAAR